jgi:UrcA family protein
LAWQSVQQAPHAIRGRGQGAQIAHAGDLIDDSPRQVLVHFADLDVTRVEGATTLYHRLQNAAKSVCSEDNTRDLASAIRVKACESNSISAAVTQINRPTLTAYYRAKVGDAKVALRQASR